MMEQTNVFGNDEGELSEPFVEDWGGDAILILVHVKKKIEVFRL